MSCKGLKELHYEDEDFTLQGFSVYGTYENQPNIPVSTYFSGKLRKRLY